MEKRKTRYTLWAEKLNEQAGRLDVAFHDAHEVMSLPSGETIECTLHKGGAIRLEIDGNLIQIMSLRPYFARYQDTFEAFLESLAEQVDSIIRFRDLLLTSITEDMVPAAVLARLKGEGAIGNSFELLQQSVATKLRQLMDKIPVDIECLRMIEIDLPVGEQSLTFEWSTYVTQMKWGNMSAIRRGSNGPGVSGLDNSSPEDLLYFEANFPVIEKKVDLLIKTVLNLHFPYQTGDIGRH